MPRVGALPTDVPIAPEDYSKTDSYELLAAAARGHLAFDQRLLHALLDDPARAREGIVKFAVTIDHSETRVDLSVDLMNVLAAIPTPEALPFVMNEIRRFPDEIPDEAVEVIVRIGHPALEPLLDLARGLPDNAAEIGFHIAALGIKDDRVEDLFKKIGEQDKAEEEFLREIHQAHMGEQVEPYDIWGAYPHHDGPDLSTLPTAEREQFLESRSAELRALGVESWEFEDLDRRMTSRFVAMAQHDPDPHVRGLAARTLRGQIEDPAIRVVLEQRLAAAETIEERIQVAIGLIAGLPDSAGVRETILAAYEEPRTRRQALEAMWLTHDGKYGRYMEAHLEDPDPALIHEAIYGVGFLRLRHLVGRLEPYFHAEDLRLFALQSYMLAAPAEESRFGLKQLESRVAKLAGGLNEEEQEVVRRAMEHRLEMAGREVAVPVTPVRSEKVGRNDPCPCGSGKKYKKCCGG